MLFHESLIGPRWLAAVGATTLVFLAVITAISAPVVAANAERIGEWVIVLLLAAFVLVLSAGLIALIRRITVSVTETHISAHLTPFRVIHINLADVVHAEIAQVSLAQAGGLGWRTARSDRFVLWSAGPAVWVLLSDGSSRVLRSERAQDIMQAVTNASRARHFDACP